jgi:3-isopropylmalate dehydrogenase
VLLGSRGMSFGGSYAANGAAVYQTNHGAAFDLAGTDCANPAAHLLALAMLLRQSHGLHAAADALERAIEATWAAGLRTRDLAEPGTRIVGAAELGGRIVAAVAAAVAGAAAPRVTRHAAG